MKRIRETLARLARSSGSPSQDSDHSSNLSLRTEKTESRKSLDSSRSESLNLTRDAIGPLVLIDTAESHESGVDVVFVHGLYGHRVQTWNKSGVLWPRDFLSKDLPPSRIITWGYAPPMANTNTFSDMAERLLSDVSKLRSVATRPIIFVGHGLGGLIIKEALVTAAMSRIFGTHHELGNVYPSTIGVLFLGTPHVGSGRQSLGDVIAATAQIAPQMPNKQLLQLIRDRSEMFENQRDSFVMISRDIPVICVRETLPTPMGYMVPTLSSSYDGHKVFIEDVHAHHHDLSKFANRQDAGYKQIKDHIAKLSSGPSPEGKVRALQLPQWFWSNLHESRINGKGIEKPTEERIDEAYGKTCEWVLTAANDDGSPSLWHEWLDSSKDAIFWMSGKAGSGKSTVMKYAYHSEETKNRLKKWANGGDLMMAAVFLFEAGSQIQKSREGILRSILWQILSPRPELIYTAFPTYFGCSWPPDEPFNTVTNLTQGFYSLFAKQSQSMKLCVFLDGLDEYRLMDRRDCYNDEDLALIYDTEDGDAGLGSSRWITDAHKDIAQLINEFGSKKDSFKICVTSRELPVFEEAFADAPRLRVHQHSDKSIAQICAARLEQEVPGLSHITYDLCVDIAVRSQGDILWARLVADMLISQGTLRTLKQTLDSLPQRLGGSDGLYMHMIAALKPEQQNIAYRIFRLVMRSIQPPCLITLAFAEEGYLVNPNSQDRSSMGRLRAFNDKSQSRDVRGLVVVCQQMKDKLKTSCAGLLEAEASLQELGQRVVFMHQTAKEFAGRKDVWDKVHHAPFDNVTADFCLLSGCVRHLRCFEALQPICLWPNVGFNTETWLLIANGMRYAARIDGETMDRQAYLDLVDELDQVTQQAWITCLLRHEPLFDDPQWSQVECPALCRRHWTGFEPMDAGKSPRRQDFLSLAVQASLTNYVAEKLKALDSEARRAKAHELLELAVSPKAEGVSACVALSGDYTDFHHDMPDTKVLEVLLANGAEPRSDKRVWVNAVKTGSLYFSRQSVAITHLLQSRTSTLLMLNRQRWVAAIKVLLLHGADPHMSIQMRRGSGEDRSMEERTAMEIIVNMLEGEPEFALELRELQVLVNPGSRKSMASPQIVW
ncbi:hypothetical protein SUNI508_04265 [Seiridium unicorne]|uniref:DUF676 domain-containing protein n=1 Tax=Seiridium unicorne TaxID=138068 RepID=A0ABR2VA21_9PEZI